MQPFDDIGIKIPRVYLPKPGMDLSRWAVIACDQYTSQADYWQKVREYVGRAPSTFNLILPEIFLDQPDVGDRIAHIQTTMKSYLDQEILQPFEGIVYVERNVGGKIRKGIVLALDLECYDYQKGSSSLIRATEGTIVERLPPRMKIRRGAALELPHILVLIDDPQNSVIEPLSGKKSTLKKLYDFDLMMESGHLSGYGLDEDFASQVVGALRNLAKPEVFSKKYTVDSHLPILLFAMGDGNHSLATAKAIWEEMKPQVGMDHPARYALVEIENVHDLALEFEPIHRVIFGLNTDILAELQAFFTDRVSVTQVSDQGEMLRLVNEAIPDKHRIGMVSEATSFAIIEIAHPKSNLAVGTIQDFLDFILVKGAAEKLDYIHGEDVACNLGLQKGNAGFVVPGMAKTDLFKTVILDGALPRKTFSMGEAWQKRFYMEARKIM